MREQARILASMACVLSFLGMDCDSTSPAPVIPGPALSVIVDSIEGIPNTPDAVTQASPVPISIRMRVDAPADTGDSVTTLVLRTGDGQSRQWTGRQIPIGTEFPFGSWWERSGRCTVQVEASTAKGGLSDTSIVCNVLDTTAYNAAFAKRKGK